MFGHDPVEGQLTHVNNCSRYYGANEGKIISTEFQKLWKHHAPYLREINSRKDVCTPSKPTNHAKLKIGQMVIVRDCAVKLSNLNT